MADACSQVDTDLLGLGVRLGVYLQLLAVMILWVSGGHSTIPSHGEAASATLAALLVTLLVRLTQGEIHAAEMLCVLILVGFQSCIALAGLIVGPGVVFWEMLQEQKSTGDLFAWLFKSWPPGEGLFTPILPCACFRHKVGSNLIMGYGEQNDWHFLEAMRLHSKQRSQQHLQRSIIVQLIVITASWVFNIWFWQTGYKKLQIEGCDVWASMFFAKVPAFGWLRVIMLYWCYDMVVIFGVLLLWTVCGMLFAPIPQPASELSMLAETSPDLELSVAVERVSAREEKQKLRDLIRVRTGEECFVFLSSQAIIWGIGISFIEMSMRFNGITSSDDVGFGGLGSTGQLLSLVLGIVLVWSSFNAPVEPFSLSQKRSREAAAETERRTGISDEDFDAIARSVKQEADAKLLSLFTAFEARNWDHVHRMRASLEAEDLSQWALLARMRMPWPLRASSQWPLLHAWLVHDLGLYGHDDHRLVASVPRSLNPLAPLTQPLADGSESGGDRTSLEQLVEMV